MATGIAEARADAAIDGAVALGTWIKLHTGDPGGAGTANAATETDRQQATFAAADGGEAVTTTDLEWESVAATETITHFSMWSASTDGTFLWSGTVSGGSVAAGNNILIEAGDLSLSVSGAA